MFWEYRILSKLRHRSHNSYILFSLAYNIPFKMDTLLHIAEQYGTPTYVYSEQEIIRRCRQLKATFPDELSLRWLYAMKANDNPHILKCIAEQGFGFDTVSSEEMHLGLLFQSDPQHILYTENNMSDEEMHDAVQSGVIVNVGSISRLKKLAASYPGSKVCIRIKPDIGDGHHSKVVTGSEDSKFGIRIDALKDLIEWSKTAHIHIIGVHMHIGSGIQNPENLFTAMNILLEVSRPFPDLAFINFGGGLPIPYSGEEKEFDLEQLHDLIVPLLRHELASRNRKLSFWFEPGRYLTAQSGVLLTTVTTVKDQGPRIYLGCDTGFNHLIRPVLYDAWHEVLNISRFDELPTHTYTLAGNICESGDLLAEHRQLPLTQEGDLLALADTGAYGMVMASSYNRRRLPAEVLVKHNGDIECIRKRERVEDVIQSHLKACDFPTIHSK